MDLVAQPADRGHDGRETLANRDRDYSTLTCFRVGQHNDVRRVEEAADLALADPPIHDLDVREVPQPTSERREVSLPNDTQRALRASRLHDPVRIQQDINALVRE